MIHLRAFEFVALQAEFYSTMNIMLLMLLLLLLFVRV